MSTHRVLIIDDSVVIRRVLSEALKADPTIEVVGHAADGRIGLSKITQVQPDLITLDIEMPGLSGFETLKEIRKLYPKLPVIMFSTLTEKGAAATLDALALGASDYVTKPSNTGSLDVTLKRIREELIPKVKALCSRSSGLSLLEPSPNAKQPAAYANIPQRRPSGRIEVLAIGTSTGGPNALSAVLPALSRDFPVPIVITQHMPPLFTRLLAERLDKESQIQIREGVSGGVLTPGKAWIAPGDHHMVLERQGTTVKLSLNQEPPENSCRPAVDVMFRSVANVYGPAALAVVMTGMGSDGVRGSAEVRERGGAVVVQDEASSVVWGMPGQVAAAGLADRIVPLEGLASEIERLVRNAGTGPSVGSAKRQEPENKKSPANDRAVGQPIVGLPRAE
ncbi:MAG TPA: chemotaxis response regulator protein-glutamate methylesterase [Candidatus Acidoferrum sp.]|nr:chemotaxis response regulator protein-glutamate methylesterase [Candidatus Acidoferrum sp.]